tara:strand:- start:272 stop:499 length:228 start_codon:yes stop_codon:yes gene_type:complete
MPVEWNNRTYPKPIRFEVGCKVSWYTYATEEEAKVVSAIADLEAIKQARQGFDFGYCCPGDIRKEDDGAWTVTIP